MLSHGHDVHEVSQQLAQLVDITHTIERRLLQLVKEGIQKAIPLEDIVSELSLLAKEVERCYRRIACMRDRRDFDFKTEARFQEIDQHCVWLHRRIYSEQCFFRRWRLEIKLRTLISAEAFGVYQEILDAEHLEREYLMQGDAGIARRMLEKNEYQPGQPEPMVQTAPGIPGLG